jgi:hypothetical protein
MKLFLTYGGYAMKRIMEYFLVIMISTLTFSGCAESRKCGTSCKPACAPATQPACTQPARQSACVQNTECTQSCEVVIDPIIPDVDRPAVTRELDRQVHNAELADMSLADVHFLPNRAGLNSTGSQRLSHLAWLANEYGGTIKLDLKEPKGELTDSRLATVKAYLKSYGLTDDKIKVEVGLPDNEGMSAQEAITVYNDTRYKKRETKENDDN